MTTRSKALEVMTHCAGMRSRQVARRLTRAYDEALRPAGLTLGQFILLVALELAEPDSITALSDALGMDRSTLTRNLRPLEKAGLVAAERTAGRRGAGPRLTDSGRAALDAAHPLWRAAQERLRAQLGDETWSAALASFDAITAKL